MAAGHAIDTSPELQAAAGVDTLLPTGKTCPECGRTFTKAAHLLRHSRSHAQQKPFRCTKCDKAFARTDALQRHERTVHSVKRRRSDSLSYSASLDGEDCRDDRAGPSNYSHARHSTTFPYAMNDQASHRSYGRPTDAQGISPTSTFNGLSAGDTQRSYQQINIAPPGDQRGYAPPNFLAGFPSTNAPPDAAGIEQMLAQWLDQNGGAMAAESALAVVFADPDGANNLDQYLNGGSHNAYQETTNPSSNVTDWNRSPDDYPTWSRSARTRSGDQLLSSDMDSTSHVGNSGSRQHRPASPLSPSTSDSSPSTRLGVIVVDTWESGLPASERSAASMGRSDSPLPSKITSPEQVVGELHSRGFATSADSQDRTSVIPSMKFLDSCLHLYFRDFHPSFPIIHKPTFCRDRTSPLLLLSMCSIGCMFVGTQGARENGLWIYERLHYVVVVTRDSKMASEETRLAITLSSLLGQCLSFLYGKPKQMLTAELFHGTLCTMARRNGLSKKIRKNPVTSKDVAHLDRSTLERRWRQWGQQETYRRVSLGLTIHAAELTAFSGLPRLMTTQLSGESDLAGFSDALFEAGDPETWRALLIQSDSAHPAGPSPRQALSATPELFLPTVLLAQSIVDIQMVKELEKVQFANKDSLQELSGFYNHMIRLANEHEFAFMLQNPRGIDSHPHTRCLSALFHHACALRLSPVQFIEDGAGREGRPCRDTIDTIRTWANSPAARLATLHCGQLLYQASNLTDLGFLIPRAIFQATLVLYCYLSYVSPPPGAHEMVDVLDVVDWHRLVQLVEMGPDEALLGREHLNTPEERYIAYGTGSVRVKGFMDGHEKLLDIVSLRSTSNRLLRRCTPWGVAETLGDILSSISF